MSQFELKPFISQYVSVKHFLFVIPDMLPSTFVITFFLDAQSSICVVKYLTVRSAFSHKTSITFIVSLLHRVVYIAFRQWYLVKTPDTNLTLLSL